MGKRHVTYAALHGRCGIKERRKSKGNIPSTSIVKQRHNLVPVLIPFAIQAAAKSMNRNRNFHKPYLPFTPKNLMNQRDNAKTGHESMTFNRSFYAAFVSLSREKLTEESTFITTEFAPFD